MRNNRCTRCGNPYRRRDKVEVWSKRNPGHRDGWQKEEARLCMDCSSMKVAQRVMVVANIAAVPTSQRRHAQREGMIVRRAAAGRR